jgi:hypothetical protein
MAYPPLKRHADGSPIWAEPMNAQPNGSRKTDMGSAQRPCKGLQAFGIFKEIVAARSSV